MKIDKEYESGELPKSTDRWTAVYIIRHVVSGCFYIGSTQNFRNRYSEHNSGLRTGTHHSKKLQELYNEDKTLTWSVIVVGSNINDTELRSKAYDIEQELLTKHQDDPALINGSRSSRSVVLSPEDELVRLEKLRIGLSKSGVMEKRVASIKKAFSNKEVKERHSRMIKARFDDPVRREKARQWSKGLWNDPEMRKRFIDRQKDPKIIAEMSLERKKRWRNPAFKERLQRQRNDPGYNAKVQAAAKASGHFVTVSIRGTIYDSIADAARKIGVQINTIRRWIASESKLYEDCYVVRPSASKRV